MRLRFTIGDLLWLVVVVALSVAWWVDRRAIGIQRDEVSQLRDLTAGPAPLRNRCMPIKKARPGASVPPFTKITVMLPRRNHRWRLILLPMAALALSSCNSGDAKKAQETGQINQARSTALEEHTSSDLKASLTTETSGVETNSGSSIVVARLSVDPAEVRAGESFKLKVEVQIARGWHIYAISLLAENS